MWQMHISSKMNGTSLTQKPRNVFYLVMEKKLAKGYRLYGVENKKILYSRNVRFNEGEVQSQEQSEDTGSN